MASWKIYPDLIERGLDQYVPFLQSRKFFAVDDSGSTRGAVLRRERAFVEQFCDIHRTADDALSLWGSFCSPPTLDFDSVIWISRHRGTKPSEILKTQSALDTIMSSDVWFLLTDGEIPESDVRELSDLAHQHGVLNVPLVFVIVGTRGETPSITNISVGIPFFASSRDTLILFKETSTGKLSVIAAKGCFQALAGSEAAQDLQRWDDMPVFNTEAQFFAQCDIAKIEVVKAQSRGTLPNGVSLGSAWEEGQGMGVQIDMDALLQAGFLSDDDFFQLFAEDTFQHLAIAYRTRGRIGEMRSFVQKQKIAQTAPKLEDFAGAAAIISKLDDTEVTQVLRSELQRQLREAHTRNREHYLQGTAGSEAGQIMKKRNLLVDAAFRTMASIETASFSAEILSRKSNRARRAEAVTTNAIVDIAILDLDGPSCRGHCPVCSGENVVMSICLTEPDAEHAEDNTTDFALNAPLAAGAFHKNVDLVSRQIICFQCAPLLPFGGFLTDERIVAVLPTVYYYGGNKKYINDQLYLALTARLATGAAGIAQLFMAILLEVLEKKSWAGARNTSGQTSTFAGHETEQRGITFAWMLQQLASHTITRRDFKETGDWVKYPEALAWVAEDYQANGLASFAVTYPAAGFKHLLTIGEMTEVFSTELLRDLKSAKTLYSVTAKYLAELQTALQNSTDDEWKHKYLEVIYRDFNGPCIPRDNGTDSLVNNVRIFQSRLAICTSDLNIIDVDLPHAAQIALMHKVQLLIHHLVFTLKHHCTAQTFFSQLALTAPLAPCIFTPSLSIPLPHLHSTLLSLFTTHASPPINPPLSALHNTLIPFASPFGPSVLHCGAPACLHPFTPLTSPAHITPAAIHAARSSRTTHLIAAFGLTARFETSQTGLPERPGVAAGHAPSSLHTNMHMCIIREWCCLTPHMRRDVLQQHGGDAAKTAFCAAVRRRISKEGRGDVYNRYLERDVRDMLPSFFAALRRAVRMRGRGGEVEEYEHDFTGGGGTFEGKVRWEMDAAEEEEEE